MPLVLSAPLMRNRPMPLVPAEDQHFPMPCGPSTDQHRRGREAPVPPGRARSGPPPRPREADLFMSDSGVFGGESGY
jgi:hypothetical protein